VILQKIKLSIHLKITSCSPTGLEEMATTTLETVLDLELHSVTL